MQILYTILFLFFLIKRWTVEYHRHLIKMASTWVSDNRGTGGGSTLQEPVQQCDLCGSVNTRDAQDCKKCGNPKSERWMKKPQLHKSDPFTQQV